MICGNGFVDIEVEDLDSYLHPAVEQGFLLVYPAEELSLLFAHDKIQEAAYK